MFFIGFMMLTGCTSTEHASFDWINFQFGLSTTLAPLLKVHLKHISSMYPSTIFLGADSFQGL